MNYQAQWLASPRARPSAWMTAAYHDHGYTMAEIAADGLRYSSVSETIKAHEAGVK